MRLTPKTPAILLALCLSTLLAQYSLAVSAARKTSAGSALKQLKGVLHRIKAELLDPTLGRGAQQH